MTKIGIELTVTLINSKKEICPDLVLLDFIEQTPIDNGSVVIQAGGFKISPRLSDTPYRVLSDLKDAFIRVTDFAATKGYNVIMSRDLQLHAELPSFSNSHTELNKIKADMAKFLHPLAAEYFNDTLVHIVPTQFGCSYCKLASHLITDKARLTTVLFGFRRIIQSAIHNDKFEPILLWGLL